MEIGVAPRYRLYDVMQVALSAIIASDFALAEERGNAHLGRAFQASSPKLQRAARQRSGPFFAHAAVQSVRGLTNFGGMSVLNQDAAG